MATECPVCREPIPWTRTCFTTAWGSWRCAGCASLLGIRVTRRILVVLVWLVVFVAMRKVVPLSPAWDLPAPLLTFFVIFTGYLVFLERVRVVELCGFRCRECGYDLQGQVDPRCPECGLEFDASQRAWMQRAAEVTDAQRSARPLTRGGLAVLAAIFALTIALVAGLLTFKARNTGPGGALETKQVLIALLAYVDMNEGRWPSHAIDLSEKGGLPSTVFTTFDSLTMPERVPLAEVTLAQYREQSAERKDELARAAGVMLPAGTVAHRLGDFVFMYHGVNLAEADPNLWLVIWTPDPDQNPPHSSTEVLSVGLVGGEIVRVGVEGFIGALSSQNVLRQRENLPRLSNPLKVIHTEPMAGEPAA